MKMKLNVLSFLIVFCGNFIKAQDSIKITKPKAPIPAEVFVGNNRLYYQVLINRSISKNNKVGVFNISSLAGDYKNDILKNEYLTSTLLYYSVFKGISINTGATFTSVDGIKPYIGLQYFYANKTLLIFYLPSYYYTHDNKISNLAIVEYKTKLNHKFSIYSRIQGIYTHNIEKNEHYRSYIYGRLGLTYSNFTLGVGVNFDWYGAKKLAKENYGIFLRVTL